MYKATIYQDSKPPEEHLFQYFSSALKSVQISWFQSIKVGAARLEHEEGSPVAKLYRTADNMLLCHIQPAVAPFIHTDWTHF